MSSQERQQILHMLESRAITAEQALTLLKELEYDSWQMEGREASGFVEPNAGLVGGPLEDITASRDSAVLIERGVTQARNLWEISLWIGVGFTILSALGIYFVMQNFGYNFWYYYLELPFLLGVVLMALADWSRAARWLYVNIDRPDGHDRAKHIFFGFPIPLGLASWFMRIFEQRIRGMQEMNINGISQAISIAHTMDEPIIVNVDDSEDGEHVQVFFG